MKYVFVSLFCFVLVTGFACTSLAAAPPAAIKIVTGSHVTLVLTDGTHLVGTVTRQDADKVYFKSDLLGGLVLAKKDIASVGAAPAPTAAPAAGPPDVNPTATKTAAVKWGGSANASYAYISGQAPSEGINSSNTVQLSGVLQRASKQNAIAFLGRYLLQKSGPGPDTANDTTFTVAYNRPLNDRWAFVSRTTLDMNRALGFKYAFTTLDGLATFLPPHAKKVRLMLAPGISYEHSALLSSGLFIDVLRLINFNGMGVGGYENLTIQFNPQTSLVQSQLYVYTPSNGRNQDSGTVTLTGMVSRHVGLSISLNYQYDSILPAPVQTFSQMFTSGIQIKF